MKNLYLDNCREINDDIFRMLKLLVSRIVNPRLLSNLRVVGFLSDVQDEEKPFTGSPVRSFSRTGCFGSSSLPAL